MTFLDKKKYFGVQKTLDWIRVQQKPRLDTDSANPDPKHCSWHKMNGENFPFNPL
jgi:hypothetical protein